MPTSALELWPTILHLVWKRPHERVLDIGAGHGKGAVLLREYVGVREVDGVEPHEPYVSAFHLTHLYCGLYPWDVRELTNDTLAIYDGVLMVDVLEHLDRDDGLALLARIPGWIVVCTPVEFFQNPEADLIPWERHRSVWSVEDFGDRVDEDASRDGAVIVALAPLTRGGEA